MISLGKVKRMARRAAELGDAETVALCDEVLSGVLPIQLIANLVAHHEYHADLARGWRVGWQTRTGGQS